MRSRGWSLVAVAASAAIAVAADAAFDVADLAGGRPAAPCAAPVSTAVDAERGAYSVIVGERDFFVLQSDSLLPRWLAGDQLSAAAAALGESPVLSFHEDTSSLSCPDDRRDHVARALDAVRAARPSAVSYRLTLARVGDDGAETAVLADQGRVEPGSVHVIADAEDRLVVSDFDVELAQASSIGDPVMRMLRTGASAAFRVRQLPGSRSAVVEAVTRVVTPLDEPPIDLGHPGFGEVDRCAVGCEEAAAAFRVDNGRPSVHEWVGRLGSRLRLRLEATWDAPPAAAGPKALLWSPGLSGPVFAFHRRLMRALPNEEDLAIPSAHWSLDSVLAQLSGRLGDSEPQRLGDFALLLEDAPDRTAAAQADAIAAAYDAALRTVDLQVLAVNVPAGAVVTLDGPLPEGAFVVAGASGPALRGLSVCFTGGALRRYVCDWDVEVAQSARIPDPLVSTFATGQFLSVNPRAGVVGIDLDLSRLDSLERRQMPLAVGRRAQGVQDDTSSGAYLDPPLPPEQVAVEKPVLANLRIAAALPLAADGTASLRRTAPGFAGAGREIVVLVRAR